jgi:hypothetical protein
MIPAFVNHEATKDTKTHEEVLLYKAVFVDLRGFVVYGRD